jgi:CTP:molybdopterin cytidylyltransferase MocA
MSTVAIVLAADTDPEFDGPKYLARVHGEAMLQRVVNDASSWPVDEVLVVRGADAEGIIESIDFRGHTVIVDPGWSEGNASPMRAALDLASRDRSTARCVMARGDQPGVDAEMIGALLDTAADTEAEAVVPKYRYAIGWPVVLGPSLWEPLLASEGSVDLLDLVVAHSTVVGEVWYDHLAPPTYATPQDLPDVRR